MCAPKAAPAESVRAIIIGRMTDSTPVANAGAAPLKHLGVIRITGADAANFIHNQLTQDFLLLPPQHARYAQIDDELLAAMERWELLGGA